jgi:hypothetical protein
METADFADYSDGFPFLSCRAKLKHLLLFSRFPPNPINPRHLRLIFCFPFGVVLSSLSKASIVHSRAICADPSRPLRGQVATA